MIRNYARLNQQRTFLYDSSTAVFSDNFVIFFEICFFKISNEKVKLLQQVIKKLEKFQCLALIFLQPM